MCKKIVNLTFLATKRVTKLTKLQRSKRAMSLGQWQNRVYTWIFLLLINLSQQFHMLQSRVEGHIDRGDSKQDFAPAKSRLLCMQFCWLQCKATLQVHEFRPVLEQHFKAYVLAVKMHTNLHIFQALLTAAGSSRNKWRFTAGITCHARMGMRIGCQVFRIRGASLTTGSWSASF